MKTNISKGEGRCFIQKHLGSFHPSLYV